MGDHSSAALPAPAAVGAGVGVDRVRLRDLFEGYFDAVWRFMARHGVGVSDLEDAVQQVFLVLAQKAARDEPPPHSERAYLFGVAMHVAQSYWRHGRRRRAMSDEGLWGLEDPARGPEDATEDRRAHTVLMGILGNMPDDVRSIFVLFELEELTMAEIAVALDIPTGTVASRLRRARAYFEGEAARSWPRTDEGGRGRGP